MSEKYQELYLTLNDGRVIKAIVKEFCKQDDRLFVHPQFQVSEPKELPNGCRWVVLNDEEQAK